MKAWWQQLAPRERRMLLIGGGALAVIFYVFLVRLPGQAAVEELSEQVTQERELANWMEQTRDQIRALSGESGPDEPGGTDQALFSLADESARTQGLEQVLGRVEPAGDDGARVNFEDIAFDDLLRWLIHLRREHGVIADQVTVREGSREGRVNVQLVLETA